MVHFVIRTRLLVCLLIVLSSVPMSAAAQSSSTWAIGSKTFKAAAASGEPSRVTPPEWRLRVSDFAAGSSVPPATLSIFFGSAGAPAPGRYRIVSADSALHAGEASFMARANGPAGERWSYNSTGTGNHYLTVSVSGSRLRVAMPAAPAFSDDAAVGAYISAEVGE